MKFLRKQMFLCLCVMIILQSMNLEGYFPFLRSDVNAATNVVEVQMYNSVLTSSSNTIGLQLRIVNTGTNTINLSDIKLRYYYTIDEEKAQNFFCDYSQVGSSNVTGTFTKMPTPKTGADYYLEMGFTSNGGSLAANASVNIQARAVKSDWTNYTQTGDYSFNSTATGFVDWNKVSAFFQGNLVWGNIPGGGTATPTRTISPTPTLSNTPTPTFTSTPTCSNTPTPTFTSTPTRSNTPTPTSTAMPTASPTSTATPTAKPLELLINPSFDLNASGWQFYVATTKAQATGARDTTNYESAPASYKVNCVNKGTDKSHIQLFTSGLNIEKDKIYVLQFVAKASTAFDIPSIELMKKTSPWTGYASPASNISISTEWQVFSYTFKSNTTDIDGRITFFLGNSLPNGAQLYLDSMSFKEYPSVMPEIEDVTVEPDVLFVNEPEDVIISAKVPYDYFLGDATVNLEQIDEAGNIIALGSMSDDGNSENGDVLAGDNIYCIKKQFLSSAKGDIKLRVNVAQNTYSKDSDVYKIMVINQITETDMDTLMTLNSTSYDRYVALAQTIGDAAAKQTILDELKNNTNVSKADLTNSDSAISVTYKCGVSSVITLTEEADSRGLAETIPLSSLASMETLAAANVTDPPSRMKRKAIILAPYLSEFGSYDEATLIKNILSNYTYNGSKVFASNEIVFLSNQQVTIEALKTIYDYGIIALTSHSIFNPSVNSYLFMTSIQATKTLDSQYQKDLAAQRLIVVSRRGRNIYGVTERFVKYYANGKRFPDSLVYFGACQSARGSAMSDAFIKNGAKTYLGYTINVTNPYTYAKANEFFTQLFKDQKTNKTTTGSAFPARPECFKLVGSSNLKPAMPALVPVNFAGSIGGFSDTEEIIGGLYDVAYLWSDGTLSIIENPTGGYELSQYDISRNGKYRAFTLLSQDPWKGGSRGETFLWNNGNKMSFGDYTKYEAMNNIGQVIYRQGSSPFSYFLWNNGKISLLPGSSLNISWTSINNKGQAILCDNPGGVYLWDKGHTRHILTTYTPYGKINDQGAVIFKYNNIIWQNGKYGTINAKYIHDLNDRGQMIYSDTNGKFGIWSNGVYTPLPSNFGAEYINNLGEVAGAIYDSSGNRQLCIYYP